MDSSSLQHQRAVSRKIWGTAVNTVLSAMESILLDEDLRTLWPREQRSQDLKKKIYTPLTPTLPLSHDPTFSPPLKRKHEPVNLSERETKSQKMTDHLTTQLATRLHVSHSDQDPASSSRNSSGIREGYSHLSTAIEFQLTLPNRKKQQRRQSKQEDKEHDDDAMMDNDHSTPPSTCQPMQPDSMDASSTPPSLPSAATTTTEVRKYRTPTRNRSGPSTPVSSHPPSPSPFFGQGMSRMPLGMSSTPHFSFTATHDGNTLPYTFGQPPPEWWSTSHHQQQQHLLHPPPPHGLGIVSDSSHQSYWRGPRPGNIVHSTSTSSLNHTSSTYSPPGVSFPSSESSSSSSSSSPSLPSSTTSPTAPHYPLLVATRLALFHRVLAASASEAGCTSDMSMWISRQASRHHVDCAAYESALTAKIQLLDQHLALLHDIFAQKRSRAGADEMQRQAAWTANQESDVQTNEANQGARSGNCPEFSYTAIQSTTDAILELAYWICEPDFDMDLGRLSPGWRQHASSLEQVVHYVQVVESMRETVSSGPFHHRHLQHPIDLAEDLAQCQEVIDYQRTLFGEILRNNGLAWRSLGLPAMDRLIESTQLWILQLAKTATARIQAEVQWAIHAYQQQLEELSNKDGARGGWALDLDKCPDMDTKMANGSSSRSMAEVMELVLQGALLTNSCLELVGIPCPALVTSWLILSTPYCWYALTSRQQFIAKMSIRQQNKVSMQKSTSPLGFRIAASQEMDEIVQSSTSSPLSTGSKVGGESLASARMSRGSFLKTMAIFENVSRLLQCLMEMREGEEILIQESKLRFGSYESSSGSASATAVDSEGLDELAMMSRGVFNNSLRESATDGESSTASSDQDDAMDGVTTALSPGANTILGSTSGHASSPSLLSSTHQSHQNQHHLHPHHPSRSPPFSSRRKSPISSMSPTVLERLKATEELAAILVEASLELCSSMAEALGQGCSPSPPVPVSTTTTSSPSARGLSMTPAAIGKSLLFRTGDVSNPFAYEASIRGLDTPSPPPLLSLPPTLNGHHGINTSPAATSAHYYHHQHQQQQQQRNRGALAVATLTTLGGGGAMASGSGGVGLIYVQFVVRFLTKVIEFSGVDFAQDQRLVRIHASLQNLEATLSAS